MHLFSFPQDSYTHEGHAHILLKNSLGVIKMKKELRTSYYSNGSTSTLNKQNSTHCQGHFHSKVSIPTLEDLIQQFDQLETKFSDGYCGIMKGRMSCVNSSNMLRSTREALNQYPRYSLDGTDAMYRSTYGNKEGRRRSICCDRRSRGGLLEGIDLGSKFDKGMPLPHTSAGESVVWCKPGVVARLMGLEAIPLPVNSKKSVSKENFLAVLSKQNPGSRFERLELEA